jgi:hypothetical protein
MYAWSGRSNRGRLIGAALAVLLFIGMTPIAGASAHFRVDHFGFNLGFPLPLEGGCDTDGLGAVVFCDALQGNYTWNKYTISVRGAFGLPTGGYFQFRGVGGELLTEGEFCRDYTNTIPLGARSLYVQPGVMVGQCATPAVQGDIVVAWRTGGAPPVSPPPDPEEPCHEGH